MDCRVENPVQEMIVLRFEFRVDMFGRLYFVIIYLSSAVISREVQPEILFWTDQRLAELARRTVRMAIMGTST